MSKEQREANQKLLEQVTSGQVPTEVEEDDITPVAPVAPVAPAGKTDDDEIVIPKQPEKAPKAPKNNADESHGILRKQRDEAREELENLRNKLTDAEKHGKIYDKVKTLIKKDEIDEADLDTILGDYDFTKKEKEQLAKQLQETQAKLKHYDITTSPEFQENYLKPFQESQLALAVELRPIVGDAPVVNEKADKIILALLQDDSVNAEKIKIAIHKIRDIYEADGVDYQMPSVATIHQSVKAVRSQMARVESAMQEWESDKQIRQKEQEELNASKGSIIKARSRKERVQLTNELMAEFTGTEDYDHLVEEFGHEEVMQKFIASHNELTEVMEDPSKAPDYKSLLQWKAKASLYDDMMQQKINSGKIASATKKKAKLDNIGTTAPAKGGGSTDPNLALLKSLGVPT